MQELTINGNRERDTDILRHPPLGYKLLISDCYICGLLGNRVRQ